MANVFFLGTQALSIVLLPDNDEDLDFTLTLIKKYKIIKECYKKAEHFVNLASNSLIVFDDSEEKKILENLTSFSLERNF